MATIVRLILTAVLLFFVYQETGVATVVLFSLFIIASEIQNYLGVATAKQLDKTLNSLEKLKK